MVHSHSDLVIMGTKTSRLLDYARLEERLRRAEVNADLGLNNLNTPISLLGRFMLGEEEIRRFTADADINTDDHPVIEFRGPRSIGRDTRPANLDNLTAYLANTSRYVDFSGLPPASQQQARAALDVSDRARAHILKGLAHDYRNNLREAHEEYSAALALQPSNTDVETLRRSVEARIRRERGPLN